MRRLFTFRPYRCLYEVAVALVAVYFFGWWVLVPLCAVTSDVKAR